jgi:hypothetical protein
MNARLSIFNIAVLGVASLKLESENFNSGYYIFMYWIWWYLGYVAWVPCRHGLARPRVPDGREGLQIWRVAANLIFSSGLPPSCWLTRGVGNKLRGFTQGLRLGRILWNDLSFEKIDIRFKMDLLKIGRNAWTGLIWFRIATVVSSYEQ